MYECIMDFIWKKRQISWTKNLVVDAGTENDQVCITYCNFTLFQTAYQVNIRVVENYHCYVQHNT